MPEIDKSINFKNNEIVAMKIFNEFPNELKTLNLSNKNLKTKITNWYKEEERIPYIINFVKSMDKNS